MATEKTPAVARDLLARYHADLVCALPEEEMEKVRIRLGGNLLQPFIDGLGDTPLTAPEVKARLETYLRDELQMADYVNLTAEGNEVAIEIKGCHLCHGNDLLRARGRQGFCPFAPGINRALGRALQGGSRLEGVTKPSGVTGECVLRYSTGA